ncbi:MAG TPA: sensor histidine kinase [Gaiellaceae bacterium]|nr:sensor histidine kinase [Gaiellaceae bacterium]
MLRIRPYLDPAVAAVLFCVAEGAALTGSLHGSRWVTIPSAALMTAPLAVRRSFPLAAPALVALGLVLQSALAESPTAIWVIPVAMLAAYTPGANLPLRPALAGGAAVLAGAWTLALLDSTNTAADKALTAPIFTVLPWLVGRVVRRLAEQRQQLAQLTDELARTAVELERARIARDLHDVVAHAVSVMVVQAEAGDSLLDRDPARTRQAFAAIESTGRAALADMRRLVHVLREGEREPRPDLAALPALVAGIRETGLRVELDVDGGLDGLPPALGLAAYRIVQEALTNTVKHAEARSARVVVRRDGDELTVVVADDGRGFAAPGGGFGLVGMRERAAAFGGTVETSGIDGEGYTVRARLPL